ncbi:MAG: peptide chain release factor-like protein [Verrucomicrobiales bacterium]|nr:peptide chain release factor-like protein [Verrucomicrobiales bacterium]
MESDAPTTQTTSMARRMAALGVREEEFEEVFVRSSGHGGQNVNKTSTCVVLVHRLTGLQVRCQESRSQGRNREMARELLLDKIERVQRERREAEKARLEKVRRQKRPRSRASKQRMLADKVRRATRKHWRRGPSGDE